MLGFKINKSQDSTHNNFDGRFGGNFEFYLKVNRGHTHFLRLILETHFSYLTPYQILKTVKLFPDSFFYHCSIV